MRNNIPTVVTWSKSVDGTAIGYAPAPGTFCDKPKRIRDTLYLPPVSILLIDCLLVRYIFVNNQEKISAYLQKLLPLLASTAQTKLRQKHPDKPPKTQVLIL
jgi:hypothetical protein